VLILDFHVFPHYIGNKLCLVRRPSLHLVFYEMLSSVPILSVLCLRFSRIRSSIWSWISVCVTVTGRPELPFLPAAWTRPVITKLVCLWGFSIREAKLIELQVFLDVALDDFSRHFEGIWCLHLEGSLTVWPWLRSLDTSGTTDPVQLSRDLAGNCNIFSELSGI
jgi:hypothetical protein